jgi:hypothetical protein
MITFGGRNGAEFYSDVWSYDCSTRKWDAPLACQGDLSIAPRCGHTATLFHNRWMVVIGGCTGAAARACVGDVWYLDLETMIWRCHSPRPSAPSSFRDPLLGHNGYYPAYDPNTFVTHAVPRARHSHNKLPPKKGHTTVNVDNTTLVVFGGTSGAPALDDAIVWCLNLRSNQWGILHTTGNRPDARMYHVAELTERRTMLVFGGRVQNQNFSNDLYELVLPEVLPGSPHPPGTPLQNANYHQQGVWRKIEVHGSIRPSARFCCTSVYINGSLCVFLGGSDCYHSDSFEFISSTQEWKSLPHSADGAGLPPCTRPTTVHNGNTITFFGGCTARNECMNTVMQLGLETPSLKELCREWVQHRTNLLATSRPNTVHLSSPVTRRSATTPFALSRQHSSSSSAFHNVQPPGDDAVDAGQVLPESLMEYLIGSD